MQNTTYSEEVLTPPMLMSPPISSLPMSSPNEDAISECVKDQLVQQLAKYDTLKLTVSRGRIEENTQIVVLTRYAKSRPDTMILKLATVEATPTPEATPEAEEETSINGNVNGATTENKLHLKVDEVGQTLAGGEKMAGEVAFEYMRETGEPLRSIELISLLVDFRENKAQVFKLCISFRPRESKIYKGNELLNISDALNRIVCLLLDIS